MKKEAIFNLFETVRESCTSSVWSQGVKLARKGCVNGTSTDGKEIVLRIQAPGLVIDPTVVLYPEDDDWECDCRAKDDICAHVAAAAIAMNRSCKSGDELPSSSVEQSTIEYRFTRNKRGLILQRFIITNENKEELLRVPLMASMVNRNFVFGFRPSKDDLTVDQIVRNTIGPNVVLSYDSASQILKVLSGAQNVFLDQKPVAVSDEPLLPEISVEDHQLDGVVLEITQSPDISEVIAPGIALCSNTLREIGERGICGPSLEKLPATLVYEKKQLAELAAETLLSLGQRSTLEINTERIPEISKHMRPRLVMEMDQEGKTLSVLPLLVYGYPPHVRIDDEKMVYLSGLVPIRDKHAEKQLLAQLRDDLNLVTGRRVFYSGKEAANFMERVQQWSVDTLDSTQQPLNDVGPLSPVVEVNDDVINISFVLEAEADGHSEDWESCYRCADSASVLSAWQEGLSMVPLEGGGWAPIPKEWLDRYGYLVSDILAARKEDNAVSTAAIPMLAKLCDELDLPRQPCFDRLAPLLDGFESIRPAVLPADLSARLRPYQRQGVDWLNFLRKAGLGAILADDMGLGKTIQTLCAISGRTLVVSPTSVLHNWAAEIRRFRPQLSYSVFHGPNRKLDENVDVVLTTYALLRIDLALLKDQDWDCVVLDEAQNIKNPKSQVAKAAYKLSGKFQVAISGTPVENRLEELWSLFHFCNRGLLGTRSSFQNRFADPIGMGDHNAVGRLQERIGPFVLRRLKHDVAPDLPPRTEQVLLCELDERERNVYNAVRATANKEIVERLSKGTNVMAALEALLRLRQCACHAGLIPGQDAESSSKIQLLLNRLDYTVANGHKALVFSQWTSLLDRVEPHLEKASIEYVRLDGTTNNRAAVVERFQSASGPPVMLVSLKAGGTGLNLTEADHVFLLDPWWNPAVEDQAADRTHRIGQEKPVMVYRLIATNTVEERILQMQQKKRDLADASLGNADKALSLTKEDLLALLE